MEAVFLLVGLGLVGWVATRKPGPGPAPVLPDASKPPGGREDTKGKRPDPEPAPTPDPTPSPGGSKGGSEIMDQAKEAIDRLLGRMTGGQDTQAAAELPLGSDPDVANPALSPTNFSMQLGNAQRRLPNRTIRPQPAGGEVGFKVAPTATEELLPVGVDPGGTSPYDDFAIDARSALETDPNVHVGRTGNLDPYADWGF